MAQRNLPVIERICIKLYNEDCRDVSEVNTEK